MAIQIDETIAKENFKRYRELKRFRYSWFKDAIRHDNFRYNQHFSAAETQDMLTFRQAPLPIGLTAAICEMAEALLTAADPIPRTVPVPFLDETKKKAAKNVAYLYDLALKSTWRESYGGIQFDKVIRDYNNVGHGFNYVVPRNEYGQFTVDYKHLAWQNVYVDNAAKDFMYRDAEDIIVSFVMSHAQGYKFCKQNVDKELTYEKFKEEWAKREAIDSPDGGFVSAYASSAYNVNESVRFIMRVTLEEQTVWKIIPKRLSGDESFSYKVVREKTPRLEKMEKDGLIQLVESREEYLTEYTSVGSYGWKKVIPIKKLNIIPTVYDHRENPFPHGRVWYMYPIQRALNKFIGLSILNASLTNSFRFFSEHNSIVNLDKIQNYGSIPGIFIEWKRVHPNSGPPQPVTPIPLTDAFLTFPKFLIYMMEYISGIWSVMQGSQHDSPDVFSTVAALQSAGGLKVKRRIRNIEASLSQTGKVIAEMYREYAPPEGFVTDVSKGDIQAVQYNKIQKMDGGEVGFDMETDLSIGFKDIEFSVESSKGFQSATEAAMLTNLATQLKVPQLVPLILDRLNVPDVDKIVDEIKQAQQLAGKVQEQDEVIQKLTQQNEKLAGQIGEQIKGLVKESAKGRAGRIVERFRKQLTEAGLNIDEFEQGLRQEIDAV